MIPFVASVRFRNLRGRGFRLWIPLAIVWLLLAPVALLLLPIVFAACWVARIDPFAALAALWQVLCGLRGADVEVGNRGSSVLIHVF
jgi:uncharacterized membrane protein